MKEDVKVDSLFDISTLISIGHHRCQEIIFPSPSNEPGPNPGLSVIFQ